MTEARDSRTTARQNWWASTKAWLAPQGQRVGMPAFVSVDRGSEDYTAEITGRLLPDGKVEILSISYEGRAVGGNHD